MPAKAEMKLTPTSHVLLGMIHLGARSGYEIKRAIELSARFFWTLSPVQIYPELKRLEEGGFVTGSDEPSGGRKRRLYTLTAEGRRALREWLASGDEPTVEWRDAGLLKLFLADALGPEEALKRIEAIRRRSERLAEEFRTEIIPAGKAEAERHGFSYPLLTAEFGLAYHEWVVRFWSERESDLQADAAKVSAA